MKWCFLIILLSFFSLISECKDSREIVAKDFSNDWLVYDKYYQAYVPYVQKAHSNILSVSKRIQLSNYKGYVLKFVAEPGLCFFIDNSIYYKNISREKEILKIEIDDIRKTGNDHEELLTFYQPDGKLPLESVHIIKTGVIYEPSPDINQSAIIFPRIDLQLSSGYYIIVFFIILALFAAYKRIFSKEYDYFMAIDFSSFSEEVRLPRPLGMPMMYILFLGGMALALTIMIFDINLTHMYNASDSFVSKYLKLTFFVFILLIVRFLYLYILGWFFDFSKFIVLQYVETVKFFVKITLLVMAISVIITFSGYYNPKVSLEQFYYFIIITLIGMAIKVIFLFFRLINFRNLYLFSYICAAEVLPIVIMVKILLF